MPVIAIGKIADLFARRGITRAVPTPSDDAGMDAVGSAIRDEDGGTGLREPRRLRYAVRPPQRRRRATRANLERFDDRLSFLLPRLRQTTCS